MRFARDLRARPAARARATAFATLALCLSAPAAAAGSHPGADEQPAADSAAEAQLLAAETRALGAEHAAEHAAVRERRAAGAGLPIYDPTAANAVTGGSKQRVGRWSGSYFEIPNYAIHSVLLPTGKVLFWGYPPLDGQGRFVNAGEAAIWDPRKGTGSRSLENVPPPRLDPDGNGIQGRVRAPLYCSGQSHLANGDVLVAGGNFIWPDFPDPGYTGFAGAPFAFTFDPFSEEWVRQPDMAEGRWYPSQVLLPDGRTLVAGGFTEEAPGNVVNTAVEAFTPGSGHGAVGSFADTGFNRGTGLYPHLFTLPGGAVALAGPNQTDLARLDLDSGWSEGDTGDDGELPTRTGGTAVLLPAGPDGSTEIAQIGGYDRRLEPIGDSDPDTGTSPARRDAVEADFADPVPGWDQYPPLRFGRSYHNTVLLPTGGLLTIGGARGYKGGEFNYWTDRKKAEERRRRVEILDPGSKRWRLGPSQREDRTYHSTALLLPDGRVFSAGDDGHPFDNSKPGGHSDSDSAEVYRPAYLFAGGKRPRITDAPKSVSYNARFGVETRKGRGDRAVLVAPGAVTHAADMGQRLVPLRSTGKLAGKSMNLISPPGPDVAPPGYYMLFVLKGNGKPSKAKFIRLVPGAPARAELDLGA